MSTFYGTQATKRYAAPSEKVIVKMQGGRRRAAHDVFTPTVALALNDVVQMGVIPKSAKIYDVEADVTEAFSAGTVNIGWGAGASGLEAGDADGFYAALALNAVSRNKMTASMPGFLKEFAEECDVTLTAPGAIPADGTIAVTAIFALD
jgi:hypothetical protein